MSKYYPRRLQITLETHARILFFLTQQLFYSDLDAVESDIEEIDGEAKKAPISPQGFTPFTPYAPSQIDRFRQMATNPVSSYAQQVQNRSSSIILLNQITF